MTLSTTSFLVLSACAALGAACGKKNETAATGSGSAGSGTAAAPAVDAAAAAPAANLSPELEALDKTIAPILAMGDEDARTNAACKALDTITTQMMAVNRNPPAGVDAAAWNDISERMAAGLDDFAIECGEGEASSTKALAGAAETAKELHALLAKKPN